MYWFIFYVKINSLVFPDITNSIELLIQRTIPLKPLFQSNLEERFKNTSNIKKITCNEKNKFCCPIQNYSNQFSIILNQYLATFPFSTPLVCEFRKKFESTNECEKKFFEILSKGLATENINKMYRDCVNMRIILSLYLEYFITNAKFSSQRKNTKVDSFYTFAISDIRSFIEKIAFLRKQKKSDPFILSCSKIECSLLTNRIQYYLSLILPLNPFYEEFRAYKFILEAISQDYNFYMSELFTELEKSSSFSYSTFKRNLYWNSIKLFEGKYKYLGKDELIDNLFLIDGVGYFKEIISIIKYMDNFDIKNSENSTFNALNNLNREHAVFLKKNNSKLSRFRFIFTS